MVLGLFMGLYSVLVIFLLIVIYKYVKVIVFKICLIFFCICLYFWNNFNKNNFKENIVKIVIKVSWEFD